jgi:hypothetical protein
MAFAVACTAAAAPAPCIECDEPVCRFGERYADDPPLRHLFRLRNEGSVTLKITGVENRCGCTDVVSSARAIRPGESATLAATLSLRRRPGPVREVLAVLSNDPARPRLELAFEGTILPYAEVEPSAALLGRVPPDRETETHIRVTFPADRPDRIVAAESSGPWFRVEVREMDPSRAYDLAIRTAPPLVAPHLYLRGAVKVKTAGGRAGELEIPVIGWIAAPVFVLPDALPLPKTGDRPLTRFLVVRPGSASDMRIEGVEPPSVGIRSTIRPLEDGAYHIRLDGIIPDRLAPGAAVRLRIRHKEGVEERQVPFVREAMDTPSPFPTE